MKYLSDPKKKKKLEQSLDLTFDFLGQPMLIALRWFYKFVPNWGVAIIFLTNSSASDFISTNLQGNEIEKTFLTDSKFQVIRLAFLRHLKN